MNPSSELHVVRVRAVRRENPSTVTLVLPKTFEAAPGQFVMVWDVGGAEKPFGVSRQTAEETSVTIRAVGPTSEKLCALQPGDAVGIRGPFGTCFSVAENALLVAGGVGAAPLRFLAETLRQKNMVPRWLVGAKTADELCYPDEADAVATDDGSFGEAGSVVALAEKELAHGKYAVVQACGPKGMLRAVKALAEKAGLPAELSVERIMRCGVGLCGSCALDDGRCACREGPVLRFG
jgi:dihydroorotate dehydrogenase electron transfer subunit